MDIKYFLDNTAPIERKEQLGLFRFAKELFPNNFSHPFAEVHWKIAHILLELYRAHRTTRLDRQGYILVHREAAKTTISSFLFPLYQIMLKGYPTYVRYNNDGYDGADVHDYAIEEVPVGENFILICSETEMVAENFTNNIRSVIDERTDLIPVFGEKQPQQIIMEDAGYKRKGSTLWQRTAFVTSDQTIVYGIGSGQQTRGRNVRLSRPTLAVVDDMYSQKNVKVETTREKLNRWFFAELCNSLDSQKGKVAWLGTLVHEDTVYKHFPTSSDWFGISLPIIGEKELAKGIVNCVASQLGDVQPPSKPDATKLENDMTTLSWRERYPLHYILSLYCSNRNKNQLDYFYAEYMNIAKNPERQFFHDSRFGYLDWKLQTFDKGTTAEYQTLYAYDMATKREYFCEERLWIAIDLAASESKASDDTVISVGCIAKVASKVAGSNDVTMSEQAILVSIEGGKYGVYHEGEKKGTISRVVEIIRYFEHTRNTVEGVIIEVSGQQALIARELRRHLRLENIFVVIREEQPTPQIKKEERIMNNLMPMFQKYGKLTISESIEPYHIRTLIMQLQQLGAGKHDDYADCLSYLFLYAKPSRTPQKAVIDLTVPFERQIALTNESRYRQLDWETM